MTLKSEWTASSRKSILICDSAKTPCSSRRVGGGRGKTDVSQQLSTPASSLHDTENRYFLKFNVKCTTGISNQHLPSFLPTLHSFF